MSEKKPLKGPLYSFDPETTGDGIVSNEVIEKIKEAALFEAKQKYATHYAKMDAEVTSAMFVAKPPHHQQIDWTQADTTVGDVMWRDRECMCDTGPSTEGPSEDCPQHGNPELLKVIETVQAIEFIYGLPIHDQVVRMGVFTSLALKAANAGLTQEQWAWGFHRAAVCKTYKHFMHARNAILTVWAVPSSGPVLSTTALVLLSKKLEACWVHPDDPMTKGYSHHGPNPWKGPSPAKPWYMKWCDPKWLSKHVTDPKKWSHPDADPMKDLLEAKEQIEGKSAGYASLAQQQAIDAGWKQVGTIAPGGITFGEVEVSPNAGIVVSKYAEPNQIYYTTSAPMLSKINSPSSTNFVSNPGFEVTTTVSDPAVEPTIEQMRERLANLRERIRAAEAGSTVEEGEVTSETSWVKGMDGEVYEAEGEQFPEVESVCIEERGDGTSSVEVEFSTEVTPQAAASAYEAICAAHDIEVESVSAVRGRGPQF